MGRWAIRLQLVAILIAGCECGDDGPSLGRVRPELLLEPTTIDFGETPIGATRHATIKLENPGTATLKISSLGTALPFAAIGPDELSSGGEGTIDVTFTATTTEEVSGTLAVASDAADTPNRSVSLKGRGVAGNVTLSPAEIDFQETPVGGVRNAEIVLTNLGLEPVSGRIVPVGFFRPEHLSMSGLDSFAAPGSVALGPRADAHFALEYRPLLAGDDRGAIRFEFCGEGCGLEVQIVATAIGSALRIDPPQIDFGSIGIGDSTSAPVSIVNDGDQPAIITKVVLEGGAEFRLRAVDLPAEIAAKGALPLTVEFQPTGAEIFRAELVVNSNDDQARELRAVISGSGEGPLFLVQPEHLSFGVVTKKISSRRALILLNAGSSELTVTALTLEGAPEFSLVLPPGLPLRLGSGETAQLAIQFLAAADGNYDGKLIVSSDDAAKPRVEVAIDGTLSESGCDLTFSANQLGFGLVPVNYRRERTLDITNSGEKACTIDSAALDPPDAFYSILGEHWPLALGPAQTRTVTVAFQPTAARDAKTRYVLQTSDPVQPERVVSLVGSSLGDGSLFVVPETIDFGLNRVSCTNPEKQVVTLYNAGTQAVTIERTQVNRSSPETTVDTLVSVPVEAGGRAPIAVAYDPTDVGVDHAELEIKIAGRVHSIVVPLRGEGAETAIETEEFEQEAAKVVDVLIIIDDSCSMRDEQDALARNFESFIKTASIRNVDFQIGITTTSVIHFDRQATTGGEGQLVGPILSRRTGDLTRTFTREVSVGTGGSPIEQGLEAMRLAFKLADARFGNNSGLLRADAVHVVVFISDEDDQSPLPPVHYFNELRQHGVRYVVAGVTGGVQGCFHPGTGAAGPAPRYLEFFRLTRGISESICSNDWTQTLGKIGQAAFGLRRDFAVTREIDRSQPIRVEVDGVPSTQFTINPVTNSVVFDESAIPPEGSKIKIEYGPKC